MLQQKRKKKSEVTFAKAQLNYMKLEFNFTLINPLSRFFYYQILKNIWQIEDTKSIHYYVKN